jgi:RNA polymerase-associated protein RTF1
LSGRRESARDKDATKAKSKKATALAALKKEKLLQLQESSDESSGFDDDDDDDSDDDYQDTLKPWQKKAAKGKSTISRLDKDVDSSDDDMDIDEDEAPKQKKSRAKDSRGAPVAEASLEDFMKVTVPRRRLARWCNEPFFKAAVLECFVRLFIGEDPDSGQKVYRLCEIVDITPGVKSYKFPLEKGAKPVSTNKMIRLRFGASEKDFPMILVSDGPVTELDIQKYITTQKNLRAEVLSKRRAAKLRRLQDDLVNNYTYTTEDIERNLKARKKEGKSMANLGLEQTKVAIAVQAARDSVFEAERMLKEAKRSLFEAGDKSDEFKLQDNAKAAEKALETAKKFLKEKEMEEKTVRDTVEERKRRLTLRSKDKNWAKVNERALQENQRADREAGKEEEGGIGASAKRANKDAFNPYARRKVKPKILWEVGQDEPDEGKAAEKEVKKDSAPKEKPVEAPALVHEQVEKATALSERHQFAIDEEGLAQSSATVGLGLGTKKAQAIQRVRKGISLADYTERKANGTL